LPTIVGFWMRPEPIVIGAIGSNPSRIPKLFPRWPVRTDIRCRDLWLLSSAPVGDPRFPTRSWTSGSSPSADSHVRLSYGRRWIDIRADLLGVCPVYITTVGDTVYFSNRLAPAIAACPNPTLDATAWASLLACWYVPPGRSVVAEISTLGPNETLRFDRRLRRVSTFGTTPPAPWESASASDLLEVIAASLTVIPGSVLLLSGGFDSRLLLGCGARSGGLKEAVTTSRDDGHDADIECARQAAESVNIPHRSVIDDSATWDQWLALAADRMDYATAHHPWAVPLHHHLVRDGSPAVVGFGGGLILNDHFQDRALDQAGHLEEARLSLLNRLGFDLFGHRSLLSLGVVSRRDQLQEEFLQITNPFATSPAWQALSILTTRTARSIAMLATRLLGPDIPVVMPYLDPQVLAVALAPSIHRRRGNGLYHELLAALGSRLLEVPSTSDGSYRPQLRYRRRQLSPHAVSAMARTIAADEVALATLHPRVRGMLVDDDLDQVAAAMAATNFSRVIHGAYLLALFRRRYPGVGGVVAR
jgi:hypothetical protein